ncbi:MAG: DNA repair protein RecO [Bacteroidetes bacterium]|nr:DNA repair protein RecO [Bacteroidota bacterium]
MIVETDAVVLQTRKYSESSKIVDLFTKEFGKISVIAKGAYSIKSKFGGCLEPLSIIRISFYKKTSTDLHLLKTSELLMPLNKIHKDTNSLLTGLIIAEFVLKTQNESCLENSTDLYKKLVVFLYKINEHTERVFGIGIQFLVYLSANMGFSVLINQDNYGAKINKLIAENNLQCEICKEKYIEFINNFEMFFSEHLEKKIKIKSLTLIL